MTMWNQMADTHVVAYLNGVATDITRYVLVPPRGGQINSARGRQTELAQMDPSRMSLTLENRDGRFTPGNPSSPYYPYWRQGVRMVWTETLGARTFTHFDGPLEIPEVQLNYQAADPTINDATLSASAVDTLTQLGRARPFISTLAAHIRYNGGTALKFYAPLTGPPWGDVVGGQMPYPIQNGSGSFGVTTSIALTTTGRALALADDAPGTALFTAGVGGGVVDWHEYTFTSPSTPFPLAAGQVVTQVAWLSIAAGGANFVPLVIGTFETPPGTSNVELSIDSATGQWRGRVYNGTLTGSFLTGLVAVPDIIQPVAIRYGFSPSVFEVWIGQNQYVGSMAGAAPTSASIPSFTAPYYGFVGSFAHAQLYVGDPSEFAFTDFQAQYQMGLRGLERQSTGDRIRLIASYAGVPTSRLDNIDVGSTVMQRASLAGRTPLAVMQEAADAERGRLFSAGDGSIVFHDRHRIYNT